MTTLQTNKITLIHRGLLLAKFDYFVPLFTCPLNKFANMIKFNLLLQTLVK